METQVPIPYSNKPWELINADRIYRASLDPRHKIASVLLAGFGVYALITNVNEYWWVAGIVFAIAASGWFGLRTWQPFAVHQRIKKDPWLLGPYLLTIADECIYFTQVKDILDTASKKTENLEWSQFSRLFETRSLFILITKGRPFPVIPKSAIENQEQINQARHLLKKHIGTRK